MFADDHALEATSKGFCCSYRFSEGSLMVMVWERKRALDLKLGGPPEYWFNHVSVCVCFSVTCDGARAAIEHQVRFFDDGLVATLRPIWAEWDAASLAPRVAAEEREASASGSLH
jgi:hypothetical protein